MRLEATSGAVRVAGAGADLDLGAAFSALIPAKLGPKRTS